MTSSNFELAGDAAAGGGTLEVVTGASTTGFDWSPILENEWKGNCTEALICCNLTSSLVCKHKS